MIYIFLQTVLIVATWHLLKMDSRIDFYIRKMHNRIIDWRKMPTFQDAKLHIYHQSTGSDADTYTSASLAKPLTNPVVLDSKPKVKRYAVSPVGIPKSGITKGKRYEAFDADSYGFYIINNKQQCLYCLYRNCSFLRGTGKNWQIIEEPVTDYELKGIDFVKRAATDDKQPDDAVFKLADSTTTKYDPDTNLKMPDHAVFSVGNNDINISNPVLEREMREMQKLKPIKAQQIKPKAMTAPIIPRGYKRHDGKGKPKGITSNTKLDIYYHRQDFQYGVTGYGMQFYWVHNNPPTGSDIIAYRLSKRKGVR